MKIEIDVNEIIPLQDFELNWRWSDTHNNNTPFADLKEIKPLSIMESKRINKAISYFEVESNLLKAFEPKEWFIASSETEDSITRFSEYFQILTQAYEEDICISWDRKTCIYTTKEVFIKYWDDFCYPISDDVTIISVLTNWVYFYNHIEVGKFWERKT